MDFNLGYVQFVYYFLGPSPEELNTTFACLEKSNFWKPRQKSILTFFPIPNQTTISHMFVNVCWRKRKMLNLVAVVLIDNEILTVTFNPYFNNFFQVVPEPGADIFYSKLKELNGYQLHVLMVKPDDATKVRVIKRTNASAQYTGKDGLTILNVLKHVNASYNVIDLHALMSWDNPFRSWYRNAKEDAKLSVMRKFDVDLFFLSLEMAGENNVTDMVYPHGKDDWLFMVAQAGYISQYDFLFSCFKNGLSYVFGFFILITPIIWFSIRIITNYIKKKKVPKVDTLIVCILENFRFVLGSCLSAMPSNFSENLFLVVLLFCDTLINNFCQSILYSVLTVSERKPQINTIQDYVNSDVVSYTVANMYEEVKRNMEITGVKGLTEKLIITVIEHMPKNWTIANYPRNWSILINQDRCEYFAARRPNFRCTKESVLPAYISFHVARHSPYFDLMETMVPRVLESGLYYYWKKKTLYSTVLEEGIIIDEEELTGYRDLSIHQFRAAVYLLLIGLAVSIITFLLELCWMKIKKLREIKRNI